MRPSDITGLTTPLTPAAATLENRPLIFALTGTLSLAVAMGIGRFAFTPLMPMKGDITLNLEDLFKIRR